MVAVHRVLNMTLNPFARVLILTSLTAMMAVLRGSSVHSAVRGPQSENNADWWSLRPLARPELPRVANEMVAWARNPVDLFIAAKHREIGLAPSPEADRRTLIRRLYFDLIGLPPLPEAVESFVADADPLAYEKLVDRLLAAPQYGERWARHWLDVVHFGETHGYDKDKPRPNAWPYRDYVIRALNDDRPYGRFVAEQVAGDVLFPGTRDGVEALGFIAAGPWDFIGHAELPETKIDGKIARHLDRDDMVSNTIGTFNSLTVHCAQCHDHKFDPITQDDYYSLQSVFAALDRADTPFDVDPEVARRRSELATRERELKARLAVLDQRIRAAGGTELAELDRQIDAASKPAAGGQRPEFGYHSAIEREQDKTKWVQVDLGASLSMDKVIYTGCYDDFNSIGAGFGFPVRFKIEMSDDVQFGAGVDLIVDHSQSDVANPGVAPQTAAANGRSARYVRVTATKLAPRMNDFIFALAELSVLDPAGKNLAAGATVTALDSIEALPRWSKKNLVDGISYASNATSPEELARLKAHRHELIGRTVDEPTRTEHQTVSRSLAEASAALAKLPPPLLVYAGTVHHGGGNFVGTGPAGGKPRPIHVLSRGNVLKPLHEVGPGSLRALAGLPARFELAADHTEGDRRAALARWLTHPNNPLTWRSIVNRVWLYHFGRGIVDTPNDFGRMGQPPTHPELLDWLAAELRDGGQSIKQLHRLIVTSATYRQSSNAESRAARNSAVAPGAAHRTPQAIDADNRYLWRMNRRRLEAEAIRDAVLYVSGRLDLSMGGPSFQDFMIERPEHSPHYEYHLHDPEDPRSHRRSVYRFIVRSQQQPWMATMDCADPSMLVDKRNETISPLQSLALLNNQLMVVMAKHFGAEAHRSDGDIDAQVARAFQSAAGRPPTETERGRLAAYARAHGLANACRVILNLNEFVFVD
jgi:hypothetical protein